MSTYEKSRWLQLIHKVVMIQVAQVDLYLCCYDSSDYKLERLGRCAILIERSSLLKVIKDQ